MSCCSHTTEFDLAWVPSSSFKFQKLRYVVCLKIKENSQIPIVNYRVLNENCSIRYPWLISKLLHQTEVLYFTCWSSVFLMISTSFGLVTKGSLYTPRQKVGLNSADLNQDKHTPLLVLSAICFYFFVDK